MVSAIDKIADAIEAFNAPKVITRDLHGRASGVRRA
jgi:hypothetical protein